MDGVEAAYQFAGVLGIRPHGLTLRQLWRMVNGLQKQRRLETVHLVCLAFNKVNVSQFLATGALEESPVGKPVVLRPDLEAQAQAEIERIRRENPDLPRIPAVT
jgi:hypothetical protein